MPCKYLKKYSSEPCHWSVASCMARNYLYVPSIAELNEYCHVTDHGDCPFFLCKQDNGEGIKGRKSDYLHCAA